MTLFEGNLLQKRQRERERKRERDRERGREKEREREPEKERKKERRSERKKERKRANSMPTDMVTAGKKAPQVEFLSSVLPFLWMCRTVFPWLTPSLIYCRVWSQVIALGGGPIALQCFAHISEQKPPAILKWSSTILTVTHISPNMVNTRLDPAVFSSWSRLMKTSSEAKDTSTPQ